MYFVARVLNPVILLNTTREAETFLDTEKELTDWSEFYSWGKMYNEIGRDFLPKRLVRLLAFVPKEERFEGEVKKLEETAQKLAVREGLRVAILRDQKTINKLKSQHPDWFPTDSPSFLLLQRSDNEKSILELFSNTSDYTQWITE